MVAKVIPWIGFVLLDDIEIQIILNSFDHPYVFGIGPIEEEFDIKGSVT